jgi:hypothetical protein
MRWCHNGQSSVSRSRVSIFSVSKANVISIHVAPTSSHNISATQSSTHHFPLQLFRLTTSNRTHYLTMASVQTILGPKSRYWAEGRYLSLPPDQTRWRSHNNLWTVRFDLPDPPPYLLFSLLWECHPISRLFLVYNILFAILHSLSRPLFLYAFITHRHLLSLPISISSYLNTVTISRRQLAPAFFQCYFILHLITFSIPCADQSVTSVPVAIYFLGLFRSPKHLPVQVYYIGHFTSPVYFCRFPSFLAHISLTPHCYYKLSSRTIIPFQSLTGIVPTHLVTCLSLHQSQNCTVPIPVNINQLSCVGLVSCMS